MTGEIPQSSALAEAQEDSLSVLFSRDPFKYTQRDRQRIIAELRLQRERWKTADAAGTKAPKTPKAALPPGPKKLLELPSGGEGGDLW